MNPLSSFWLAAIDALGYALQPIVNIHSGAVYGYEALLRGFAAAGFPSIQALFDAAFADRVLYSLDFRLREKALLRFRDIPSRGGAKLFYNLDNRTTESPGYSPGNTLLLLKHIGLDPSAIVFEVSERHEFVDYGAARKALDNYKGQNFRIALDDFGAGYAGLQLLYFAQPDIIKIDRFFVAGIDADPRKRLFAERIVDMAHLMGIQVVAEGVETEREFHACRRIGCDLVQGYFIERPLPESAVPPDRYPSVAELVRADRRSDSAVSLRSRLTRLAPVPVDQDILSVLDRFRGGRDGAEPPAAIPVVDAAGSCVGLLRERDFRKYVYSPFGISLLSHEAAGAPFGGLMAPVPVVDVDADPRAAQSVFIGSAGAEGLAVSENGRYAGFLDARSILEISAERELREARDQNPLSRLPGNAKLDEHLASRWDDPASDCLFCYFDFNDFKPFNDRYGFRRGDRVIQLFADILRDIAARSGWFVAHIGGDDFFAVMDVSGDGDEALAWSGIREAVERFSGSVAAFYDEEDRDRGWIEERDRAGSLRRFPLMSVAAAVHRKRPGPASVPLESSGELFAGLKKKEKMRRGPRPICAETSEEHSFAP